MTSGQDFNQASGASFQAYQRLKSLFADIIHHNNRYEVAHAEKWLAADDAETDAAVRKMTAARKAAIDILANPDHDVAGLLKQAATSSTVLASMDAGNLVQMQKLHDEMRPFMPAGGETAEDRIRAYEAPLGAAEQGWIATLDDYETAPQRAWQNQIPLVLQSFVTVADTMRPVAEQRGVSLYEACLQKLAPDHTEEKITGMFADLKKGYRGMAAAIRAESDRQADTAPLPLPDVDPDIQQEIFEALKGDFLEAGGWSDAELQHAGVQIQMGSAQTGFNWGAPDDIVIAVETSAGNLIKSLGNHCHEFGHTLYLLEMNRMGEGLKGQPVATFNGFGAHEFSAMYFEMAGMRQTYFDLAAPKIYAVLNGHGIDTSGPEWSPQNMYALSTRPNFHDTDWGASELSLTPNMAYRYEAECDIMGALERGDAALAQDIIQDLPNRWARTMEAYLGVPHDPAKFCVGESHWFEGLIGYFPSYMEGAHAAAQMHHKLAGEGRVPDNAATLADYFKGFYEPVRDFYRRGAADEPAVLIAQTVGGPMDTSVYMARLASASLPGMPGPDAVLAKNNAGIKPASSATLSL